MNAWQLTYFVPQDIPGLATVIGRDTMVNRLEWGFGESDKWRFNGPNDQYWDYPVVQGNQQSMHFAYLGDEDQGQMSAWFVMNALGLFQTDGGTRVRPIYEIGSPLFEKVVIDLQGRYRRGKRFTIEAKNTSAENIYVQRAFLNGKPLKDFWFYAEELLKGGTLLLEMGPNPNLQWGTGRLPAAN